MKVHNRCPSCGKIGRVPRSFLGLAVRCRRCKTKFIAKVTSGDYPIGVPVPEPVGEPTEHVEIDHDPDIRRISSEMPEEIGRFQIKTWVGRGGFCDVYLAYDPVLEREVALKLPKAKTLNSSDRVARFLREAKSAARLRHPHIVPVFDSGQDGDHYYIATAFIEGRSLDDALMERPLDFAKTATLVRALAEALAYAHTQGIVHRDIKPANIMLDANGAPYVVDFGLAARLGDPTDSDSAESELDDDADGGAADPKKTQLAGAPTTGKRVRMGTPSYWSPEQAAGILENVGPPTDQYSLGMVLYEMLCGQTAFSGPAILLQAHAQKTPPPAPRTIKPTIPEDLEAICLKTLAKQPEQRYASCQELADDLRRWLEAEETHARPLPGRERVKRWCKKEPMRAWAFGLAGFALLAVLALSIAFGMAQSQAADTLGKANDNLRKANVRAEDNAAKAVTEAIRATAAEKVAREKAQNAIDSERGTKRTLAELMLDRAQMYAQQKETGLGMPWLARSLKIAQEAEAGDLEEVVRRNLTAWTQSMHALRMASRFPKKVHALLCDPAGERFFLGSDGTIAQRSMTPQKWFADKELSFAPYRDAKQAMALTFDGGLLYAKEKSIYRVNLDVFKDELAVKQLEHDARIVALVASPEKAPKAGTHNAAFIDGNGRAWLWNMADDKTPPLGLTKDPKSPRVLSLAFSPCGQAILLGCADGTARVWSLVTQGVDWTIPSTDPFQPEEIKAVAYHPDGSRVLIARSWPINGVTELWSVPERRKLHTVVHQGEVYAVAFSRCGTMAATAGQDRSARLWSVKADSLQSLGRPLYHAADVEHIAFHPTKQGLITVDWLQTVRLWELRPETVRPSFASPAPVTAVHIDASGNVDLILKTKKLQRTQRLVKSRGNESPQFEPGAPDEVLDTTVTAFAVQKDPVTKESKLLTASVLIGKMPRTAIEMWDITTGKREHVYETIASSSSKLPSKTHAPTNRVWRVAISPNGKHLASIGWDGKFYVWKRGTSKPILHEVFEEKLWMLTFSPNGEYLAVAAKHGESSTAWVYEMGVPPEKPKKLAALTHPDAVLSAAFSPKDPHLLVTGFVGGALLWNWETGSKNPLQHVTGVFAVGFSPDGAAVVTGGQDRQARIWDVKTRKLLAPPMANPSPVYAATLTPTTLVTATFPPHATVHRWPLSNPAKGDFKELASRAELISGIRLDEQDTYEVLDAATWRELHDRLQVPETSQDQWEPWPEPPTPITFPHATK